jgi:hypothetical protein
MSRLTPPRGDGVHRRKSAVKDPSGQRRDIESFIAAGGGTSAHLLDMLRGEQPQIETALPPGVQAWLARGYVLEHGPNALVLHRAGSSFVAAFSIRGFSRETIRRSAEEDRKGVAGLLRARGVRVLREKDGGDPGRAAPWERFLRTEPRVLEARRRGQMARALTRRLPGEAGEVLSMIASEDRRKAEEELVELRSEEGEFYIKPLEELLPQDSMDRIMAEPVRIEWLLERNHRYDAISRSDFFGGMSPASRLAGIS